MTNRPLFKHKSALTKRRLIIFFILSTIIAVSVMTGFSSGLNSDGTIYTADGERIVMWKDLPEEGTPEDYDLLSNVRFVSQRIYMSPYYRGVTEGLVVANVGMGIKYKQNVDNIRVVKGNTIFVQAISSSSLKSVAEQRYYVGNNVFYRPSTSASGGNATFADNIRKFDTDEYYKAYGVIPNELTKLKIDETTILSVRDDNAQSTVAAKNASPDDGAALTFEVPQSLVPDSEGNYSVTLDLDPAESTKYSRNEVRTLASADQNPLYHSSGVTIKFTSEWKPIAVITFDNYDLALPVLGAMNCSTTMTEYFYDIDDENGEIPEQSFFEERMGDVDGGELPSGQPAPADYLATAFAKYLDGSANLDLVADINIAGVAIDNLALSVDIGTMNVRAKLDELAIEYSDNKVYITLNKIKGYFTVDKFTSLLNDPTVASLIGGLGDLPDFDNLLSGDILSTVFGACEMTSADGVTCIRLPFDLAEGISIDASLYISDEDMSLVSIKGIVKAFGVEIKLNAKPKTAKFPQVDETYACLDYTLDFIPDAIATIKSTTYGVSGNAKFIDYEFDIDAYIDRGDGIKVDATLGVFGLDIGIKYINGDIYITAGNINIHAKPDDLTAVMDVVGKFTDVDIKEVLGIDVMEKLLGQEITPELIDKFMPHTVAEWIATVKSLNVTENSLDLSLLLPSTPINIGLTRANGKLDGVKLDASLVMLTKITRISADLDITTPSKKEVTAPTDYVELSDLLDLVPTIEALMSAKAFNINLGVDVAGYHIDGDVTLATDGGISASGTISALGQSADIVYIDDSVYVRLGNVKLKLAVSDIPSLLAHFGIEFPIDLGDGLDLGALVENIDIPSVLGIALGAVKSIEKVDGNIAVNIEIAGVAATVTVGDGIGLALSVGGVDITGTLTALDSAPVITPPADGDKYINVVDLVPTIEALMSAKAFGINLGVDVAGYHIDGDVTLATDGGISASGTISALGQSADIVYIDDSVYVRLGNVKLKLAVSDIPSLLAHFGIELPIDLGDGLDLGALVEDIDIPSVLGLALGAVKSIEKVDGNIAVNIEIAGVAATVTVGDDIGLALSVGGVDITGTLTALDSASVITPPADGDKYINVASLGETIDGVLEIVEIKALSGEVALTVGGKTFNAGLAITFDDGIRVRVTEDTLGLEAVVFADLGDISATTIYIKVADIKVCGTVADIKQLIAAITPALPEDIAGIVADLFEKLDGDNLPDMSEMSPTIIAGIADKVLGMISSLADTGDGLAATIAVNDATIYATVGKDLGTICVSLTAFGKEIGVEITAITASANPIAAIADCTPVAKLMPIVDAVIPYVGANCLTVSISGALDLDDEGKPVAISGYVTVELNPVKAEISLNIGDVRLGITYDGQNVFLDIDGKLKLSCAATAEGIAEILDDLRAAFDGIEELEGAVTTLNKIKELVTSPIEFDILSMLNDIKLTSGDLEQTSYITLGYKDMLSATIGMADGALCSLDLDVTLDGKTIALSSAVGVDVDGAITLDTSYDFVSVDITLNRDDNAAVGAVNQSEYTTVKSLIGYVRPITELALDAMNAKTISLDVSARITLNSGEYLDIESKDLVISIGDTVAVSGRLVLFAGTGEDSETVIAVTFVDNEVYVQLGGIMLKLNTVSDIDRLYELAGKYLPDYLTEELGKLLGKVEGTSAFSDIGLVVDKITAIASSQDVKSALVNLLGGYGGLSSDSTLKKLLSMVSLTATEDSITVGADLGFISLSATPVITADMLTGATITTNLMGADVYITASNLDISDIETTVLAPADSDEYVSVMDFVSIIDNLVGTFTTRTDDGSITFEIADFEFDYLAKTEDGTSVTIKNMSGYSALKGKFTPHTTPAVMDGDIEVAPETTEYGVSLEMHVTLDLPASAAMLGTLGIELYLFDDYPNSPLAYLNYTEFYGNSNKNIGELVSIDAQSVLQILAATMDIIGVNDDTVEALLGKYRRDIDTTLFDSMDIVGLDNLKSLLDGLTEAIDEAKLGLSDVKHALNAVMTAGSIDNLRDNLDDIKDTLGSAIEHIQNAIQAFVTDDTDGGQSEPTEPTPPTASAMRGEQVKSVTDGIKITRGVGYISADVDNTLTTGADGYANITVFEENNTITGVDIENLDANTSLVNGRITFTSGKELEFSPIPTAPSYSTYSNLAHLKHILFDIMNTANLMEFDIGGYDTSDSIDVSLDLKNISGGALLQYLAKLNISIKYNIKVKLIPSGIDEHGKTTYQTAVVLELFYENCTAKILGSNVTVIPDCVTRLYFYDNVLYVQGISEWNSYKTVVGDVDVVYTATRYKTPGLVWTGYSYSDSFTADYKVDGMQYVNVAYTVDEFVYMLGHDMKKFLKEFLFYLVPVSKSFYINVNLQDTIADLIPTSDTTVEKTEDTFARIFKGYSYDGSKHSLTIGLKELAGNASLSDVNIEIVGRNDGDDDEGKLLNNYISSLMVNTSIQDGLVTATLNASLNNVRVTDRDTIESKGLAPTDVTEKNATFKHNGKNYVNYSYFEYDTLYTLDGNIYDTADGRLYVDHGKLVDVYPLSGAASYTSTVSNGQCEVDKPSDKGYVVGDTLWKYKHTYNLNDSCYLASKYNYTYYVGTNADGSKYIYRLDGGSVVPVASKSIIGSLLAETVKGIDGKIVSLNNRAGGVQWSRPWQASYEASIPA